MSRPRRWVHRSRGLPRPINCILLLLVSVLAISISPHFSVSSRFHTVVAHLRVSFKSQFRAWRSFPFDLSIYQGLKDCADKNERVNHAKNWHRLRECNISSYDGIFADDAKNMHRVSCEEIDDIRYPMCALEYPKSSNRPFFGSRTVKD